MPYIPEMDRDQFMMCSLDSFVSETSEARIIDAFVEGLKLGELGITDEPAFEGRPCYNPRALIKLLVYGYRKDIRSSRKMQEACKINIEVRWLMKGLEPDFRTISDFRKDNVSSMKKIFREFTAKISGAVTWGFASVDGSKFIANNAKDSNFTKNKLDDRIKWTNGHIDEYMRQLDEADANESIQDGMLTKEAINLQLKAAREKLERFEEYQQLMETEGLSQLSLVDADAKLMKNKNGFAVAYNPQTAIDSETHLIRDYQMTNQVTDHGLLKSTMSEIKAESDDIVEVVADKGYVCTEDMAECLDNGIIPHVITDDGKDSYDVEIEYSDETGDAESKNPEELKKCLHNGIIPKAYEGVVSDIKVVNTRRLVKDETATPIQMTYGTEEEMKKRAALGYFVRDPEKNVVYCPNGEALRQKSIKKNGNIRYANKNACRHCPNRNKCYKGKNEWKEIDFTKDQLEKPCRDWLRAEGREPDKCGVIKGKGHYEKRKVVRFKLTPDRNKTKQRMCLSEHPFGTIKRAMGAGYFLLRSMKKVDGEFALMCLGYNLKRAINLLGFDKMMELMATA